MANFVAVVCALFVPRLAFGGIASRDLIELEVATKVAFYDFDKTLAINSIGGVLRDVCNETRNSCDQVGDMTATLSSLSDPTAEITAAMGGADRIARVALHLQRMTASDSSVDNIFILSTSWVPIPAEEWANLIYAMLQLVNLESYFPLENILTLDDPGPGIPADKGAVAAAKLSELALSPAQCIFADDSDGNIDSAQGKCDTLDIQERAGMDDTDMNYVEARTFLPAVRNCTGTETPTTTAMESTEMYTSISDTEYNDSKAVRWQQMYISLCSVIGSVSLLLFAP